MIEKENKEIEDEIEKKTRRKVIRKLKSKIRLIMEEDEEIEGGVEETKEGEPIRLPETVNVDELIEPQIEFEPEAVVEEQEEAPTQQQQQQQQEPPPPIVPPVKKRGRKPKVLVIQEEIPLQVENIQENPVAPIKKRGRPKKVV